MELRTYREKLQEQLKEVNIELEDLYKRGVNDENINTKYHKILKKLEDERQ